MIFHFEITLKITKKEKKKSVLTIFIDKVNKDSYQVRLN